MVLVAALKRPCFALAESSNCTLRKHRSQLSLAIYHEPACLAEREQRHPCHRAPWGLRCPV